MSINLKRKFKEYVNNYDLEDDSIKRKYYHSIRVMNISCYLARKLKLSKDDINLAKIIGLLHDYARFEQWTKYKTFSDLESIDHGDLGVKLLFDNKDIENYLNVEDKYNIVYNAIKYHNKYSYPDNLNEINRIFCNIIRDSDKLDIFGNFANRLLKLEEIDKEITPKIKKDFFNNILIKRKDVKNKNDDIILLLSMIYDINYIVSLKYLDKKRIIWKIYNNLENKEMFLDYFKYIDNYIKERLKKNVR